MFLSQFRFWLVISHCFFLIAMQSCGHISEEKRGIMIVESVEQATQLIEQYHGKAADFVLPISQNKNLTLRGEAVPRDIAMAIITDKILSKGWSPNGFEEKGQVRNYKYSQ